MDEREEEGGRAPLGQRIYGSIWLWAAAAILFWILSYVVWGTVDLLLIPGG